MSSAQQHKKPQTRRLEFPAELATTSHTKKASCAPNGGAAVRASDPHHHARRRRFSRCILAAQVQVRMHGPVGMRACIHTPPD